MSRLALTTTALLAGIDTSDAGVARLFERVRDIPFSFAAHRDADTLLTSGSGTCAPRHAFLDGWVEVDATFDRPLAAAGFVMTEPWDGRTSMPLVVRPLSRVESTLSPDHEEALLGIGHRTGFPRQLAERLNDWLGALRSRRSSAVAMGGPPP